MFRFDEDLRSPIPTDSPFVPPLAQEALPSPSLSSTSTAKQLKNNAKHVPTEFAMTASPFPPESPAVEYEYAGEPVEVPSVLGGEFEVIPELDEPVSYPETPKAIVKQEDNSPSYGRYVSFCHPSWRY